MLNLSIDMQIMVCSLQVLPASLTTKTSEETLFEKNVSGFYILLFF